MFADSAALIDRGAASTFHSALGVLELGSDLTLGTKNFSLK